VVKKSETIKHTFFLKDIKVEIKTIRKKLQIEKEENQKIYRLIIILFGYPILQSLKNICIMASPRSSSKIFKNIQQTLVLKKSLCLLHMILE
jgi:hypothetical protein